MLLPGSMTWTREESGRDAGRRRGRQGERLAAWCLRLRGWSVVARNRRIAGVEVDLLARKGPVLAVVEVKSRRDGPPGAGETDRLLLVPPSQRRRLRRAARALAAAFGPLLAVTLWRGAVAPGWRIATVSSGFLLTVALSWTVESPGDWVERLVPMALALLIALLGTRR